MALVDDMVIGSSAAVVTAIVIVLAVLLSRYRTLVAESRKSSELAKNIFDSMNSRFSTQDARIIDLMARVEVYSAKKKSDATSLAPTKNVSPLLVSQSITPRAAQSGSQIPLVSAIQSERTTNDTELTILRSLQEGPKMSGQILTVIHASRNANMTREHNARLLKGLYERGLVRRTDTQKPFVYELTDAGRNFIKQEVI
jgi:predicted transcriptional regulator